MNTGEVDEQLHERFLLEARSVAKLNHPSIVSIYNMDEDRKRPYIVMEYVPGEDLKALVERRQYVPFDQKLSIIKKICEGLQYAHDKGVVHRDIKPGNIRIMPSGVPKILDFGLARLESADLTRTGIPMGTPYYMSPEQVRGSRNLDCRSDVFSLGVVVYEWLTYCRPFEAENPTAIYLAIVSESHRPLLDAMPGCAEELAAILDRALAKDRKSRYSSCQEFAEALAAFERRLPAIRGGLAQTVHQLETEFAGCQAEGTRSNMSEWFEKEIFHDEQVFDSPLEAGVATDETSNRKQDYAYLVQRRHWLEARLRKIGQELRNLLPLFALIEQSQQQMDRGELEACLSTLDIVLEKAPSNRRVLHMKETCQLTLQRQRKDRDKRIRLKNALAQARKGMEQGSLAVCLPSVDRCLSLDSGNAEALELRRLLQDRTSRRRRVQACLTTGRRSLRHGNIQECQQAVENGLRLDPHNQELLLVREAARQALEIQRQRDTLLDVARQEMSRWEYPRALESIDEALRLAPHDATTLHLREECFDALERHGRFEDLASVAKGSFRAGDYEACCDAAIQALQLIPDHLEMKQLQNDSLQRLGRKATGTAR
jgi:serine/threonine protein kinase